MLDLSNRVCESTLGRVCKPHLPGTGARRPTCDVRPDQYGVSWRIAPNALVVAGRRLGCPSRWRRTRLGSGEIRFRSVRSLLDGSS